MPCQDPQLVVVRGLLRDQKQRLETGNRPVLAERIARASYGMIITKSYSPDIHFGEDVEIDKYDPTRRVVKNQIEWLIRKVSQIMKGHPKFY